MSETKKSNPLTSLVSEAKNDFYNPDNTLTFEEVCLRACEKAYDLGRVQRVASQAAWFGHQYECDNQQ
jgi:hypothetical protein